MHDLCFFSQIEFDFLKIKSLHYLKVCYENINNVAYAPSRGHETFILSFKFNHVCVCFFCVSWKLNGKDELLS